MLFLKLIRSGHQQGAGAWPEQSSFINLTQTQNKNYFVNILSNFLQLITYIIPNMKPFFKDFQKHRQLTEIIEDSYEKEYEQLSLCTTIPDLARCLQWQEILQFRNWKKTKKLHFINCEIRPQKMKVVIKYYWENLTELYLTRNLIGGVGIKYLVKSHTPNLRILILAHCKIGDEGVNHLTKHDWRNLRILNLIQNCITVDGFTKLQKGKFQRIKDIKMSLKDMNIDWISVMIMFLYDPIKYHLCKWVENKQIYQDFLCMQVDRLDLVPLYPYNQV